jgi:hypothetical protein
MKITQRELRRLIHEEAMVTELRGVIREISRNEGDLLGRVKNSTVYLVEGTQRNRQVQSISFGHLMESIDSGKISEAKALRIWEKSVSYQIDNLIAEGVMDDLKSAYDTAKGGALKLKDKITSVASAAMEKVNDFLLKIALQAVNLAQSSVEGIVSAAKKLSGAVQRFKDSHPILFKIIMILVVMLIVFGIMSLFSGEAHASVMVPGKGGKGSQEMTQKSYEALRGALSEYGDSTGDVGKMLDVGDAIKALDKAHKAKSQIDLSALGKINQVGYGMVKNTIADARGGDNIAWKLLQKWTQIGESLRIR